METSILIIFSWATFGLLIAVSGGVLYLTIVEWRDRRRREQDKRSRR